MILTVAPLDVANRGDAGRSMLAIAGVVMFFWFRTSLPMLDGSVTLSPDSRSRSALCATVRGIPHIYARDRKRRLVRPRLCPRPGQVVPDGDAAPGRPGPAGGNHRPARPQGRSAVPHPRPVPAGAGQRETSLARPAEDARILRRRSQPVAEDPQGHAAAGIQPDRPRIRTLEAGRHAGLGQADGGPAVDRLARANCCAPGSSSRRARRRSRCSFRPIRATRR